MVPGCLFTAIPMHAPRPQLVGAATGLLMQVSNFGALIGPPITAILVSRGGWPAAAWMTSIALGIAALAGVFLHWRERRKVRRMIYVDIVSDTICPWCYIGKRRFERALSLRGRNDVAISWRPLPAQSRHAARRHDARRLRARQVRRR